MIFTSYGTNKPYEQDIVDLYQLWTGRAKLGSQILVNDHLIVVREGNVIIGAARLVILPDILRNRYWGLVEDVFVHPEHRKRGIGKQLMQEVEIQASMLGCSFIKLTTRKDLGKKLYRSLGYEEGSSFYKKIDTLEV